MRRITKIRRSVRAISPVVATLLMIAIAVVASLIVYAWVIGYIGGTTIKSSNSMLIQSAAHTDSTPSYLVVYVQNVGQGTLQLLQGESVYINNDLKTITGSTPPLTSGIVSFDPGTTTALKTDFTYTLNEKLKIKITATDGTFAEYTTPLTIGTTSGTFPTPTPVGQTPTPTPVGQTPTPTPVGQTPTPTPVGQTPTPTPVGQTPTPTPVGQTPTPTPVGQTPTPTPVGQTPTPTPSPTPTPTPTPSPTPPPTTVHVTFAVNPAGSGTTTPSGAQIYNYGQTVNIQATAGTGYTFSSWTFNGIIEVNNPAAATTSATMLGDGTITANFISSSGNKLAFTAGTNQILARNVASAAITVQRQTSSGTPITSGSTTVNLGTTSSGGIFTNSAGATISSLTISNGQSSASFYYKDTNTGTPTITASATNFAPIQTTFNVNMLYSNFDGSNWLAGWTTGTQPPWYQSAVGEGVDGTQAAKSDSTNYLGGNDGPFTSDLIDTSLGNTMTVTFMYKVQNTDNAADLKLAWSNAANPNFGSNSPDFHYIANIGLPGNNGWNSYTLTFTRAANPTMFTTHFWFRFESNLSTHQGSGLIESAWIDNAMISVT